MRLIEQSQPGNELGSEDIHLISCKPDRRVGSIAELSQHQVSTISKAFSKSLRVVTTWPVFIDKLDRVVEIMENLVRVGQNRIMLKFEHLSNQKDTVSGRSGACRASSSCVEKEMVIFDYLTFGEYRNRFLSERQSATAAWTVDGANSCLRRSHVLPIYQSASQQ